MPGLPIPGPRVPLALPLRRPPPTPFEILLAGSRGSQRNAEKLPGSTDASRSLHSGRQYTLSIIELDMDIFGASCCRTLHSACNPAYSGWVKFAPVGNLRGGSVSRDLSLENP